jgi:hypothetical protein
MIVFFFFVFVVLWVVLLMAKLEKAKPKGDKNNAKYGVHSAQPQGFFHHHHLDSGPLGPSQLFLVKTHGGPSGVSPGYFPLSCPPDPGLTR